VDGIISAASNGSRWFAMRHGNKLSKLNRPADQRKAMMRTLTTEVLNHGKITTTKVCAVAASTSDGRSHFSVCQEHESFPCELQQHGIRLEEADANPTLAVQTKAKVLRKYVDKMIALAKDGSLHARRQVLIGCAVLCGLQLAASF